MTDTLPPIAPLPADAPQATRDAARAIYAKHGYSDDALSAAFGAAGTPAGQPAPQVQQPTATIVPGTNVQVIGGPDDALSHEQRVAGFRNVLKFTPDPEAVIATAERLGITRAELEVAPADPAKAAAVQREAATNDALSAPASPLDYELNYGSESANAVSTENLQAYDREVRSAFYSAGVPKFLAQGLLSAITTTANSYDPNASEAARKLRFIEEGSRLKKLSGSDGTEIARLATAAYNALPRDFRESVDARFGWHSAEAQNALAAVGRAIEYRAQRKAKK